MKGNSAVPGDPLTSKPTWSKTLKVFDHVGFFSRRGGSPLRRTLLRVGWRRVRFVIGLALPAADEWPLLGVSQMGRKLYVGNLSYGVTDSDLSTMFGAHGTVESAQVIMDRDTGRSKGFGFVEMKTDQEAQAAIAALNGKEMEGRALTVNEARPKTEGGGRGGSGGGRGGYGGGGGGGGRRY